MVESWLPGWIRANAKPSFRRQPYWDGRPTAPHVQEDLRERKPPFRAYRKAVEFRQGPALEPDSESTAKTQSDRDPRLAVVPTRAIIIATLVDWPIIAAVSGRIAIRSWVVAVWTGLVVTIGRLAGVTSIRCGGDRRLVVDPLVAVPIDPAVFWSPVPPSAVLLSIAPLIAALIGCNPGVGIAGNASISPRRAFGSWPDCQTHLAPVRLRLNTGLGVRGRRCWS